MIESVMLPTVEQKLFQMKGDIIEGIEAILKNQHQEPATNSKSQPSFAEDLNNSFPTSNYTENDERPHFSDGDIHDSEPRVLSSDISGLTPPPNVTSMENQMDDLQASNTDNVPAPLSVSTQCNQPGREEMSLREPFQFFESPSFSLGLSQEEKEDYMNGRPAKQPETVTNDNQVKLPQRRKSLRLNPFLNSSLLPSASLDKMFEMELFPVSEIPSFSLGLSQEDNHDDLVTGFTAEQIAVEKDNDLDLQECRRSKRPKTVTHGLVDVFQCSPDILKGN
ncbi:Uncharacterized protein Rs2_04777 [Raphanus sativus]|nr:Uncharacterized protein Rs2_04777 [Raphanus sativus]